MRVQFCNVWDFQKQNKAFWGVTFSFWEKISSFWENSLYFWEKDSFLGKSIHFWEKTLPFWEKFSLFGKGEALCGKRITKDVVVNVNIKMTKKWKIKMYIFQDLFLRLCFYKGTFFFQTIWRTFDRNDLRVMQQSIQHCICQCRWTKYFAPFREWHIGCYKCAMLFVPLVYG